MKIYKNNKTIFPIIKQREITDNCFQKKLSELKGIYPGLVHVHCMTEAEKIKHLASSEQVLLVDDWYTCRDCKMQHDIAQYLNLKKIRVTINMDETTTHT